MIIVDGANREHCFWTACDSSTQVKNFLHIYWSNRVDIIIMLEENYSSPRPAFSPALRLASWMYRMMRKAHGINVPRNTARYAGKVTAMSAASGTAGMFVASDVSMLIRGACERRARTGRECSVHLRACHKMSESSALLVCPRF